MSNHSTAPVPKKLWTLAIVLGDQLNHDAALFDDFDAKHDAVWMAEVDEESTHVWSHQARIALFLSAMRHFRDRLGEKKIPVIYHQLSKTGKARGFSDVLTATIKKHQPKQLKVVKPGDWRVQQTLQQCANDCDLSLEILPDRHFLSTLEQFDEHAEGRKSLRLEYFYRELRQFHDVLMTNNKPTGGQWNYDADNRQTFGKKGPRDLPAPYSAQTDDVTQEVMELVREKFRSHPGELKNFDWPVTPEQAERALDAFVERQLPKFGDYQDALWTGEPFLYHSRLSSSLNMKLLDPRKVIAKAEQAYHDGHAPLNAVEGFIRQILGWREYVRGIYWRFMPEYVNRNALEAEAPLPDFYWTGETSMNCLRHAIGQTLEFGYAHHIQRLMVTGLYGLLLGVNPVAVHEWYLAVYVDAVEWVELPNTLGMSQYADGGVMASKPYAASGKYIQRMSNYCDGCRYNPAKKVGDDACPFTTLYWDFLRRHQQRFSSHHRMKLQVKNVDRLSASDLKQVRKQADGLRGQ